MQLNKQTDTHTFPCRLRQRDSTYHIQLHRNHIDAHYIPLHRHAYTYTEDTNKSIHGFRPVWEMVLCVCVCVEMLLFVYVFKSLVLMLCVSVCV